MYQSFEYICGSTACLLSELFCNVCLFILLRNIIPHVNNEAVLANHTPTSHVCPHPMSSSFEYAVSISFLLVGGVVGSEAIISGSKHSLVLDVVGMDLLVLGAGAGDTCFEPVHAGWWIVGSMGLLVT